LHFSEGFLSISELWQGLIVVFLCMFFASTIKNYFTPFHVAEKQVEPGSFSIGLFETFI
jgi:hypothetical protein